MGKKVKAVPKSIRLRPNEWKELAKIGIDEGAKSCAGAVRVCIKAYRLVKKANAQ